MEPCEEVIGVARTIGPPDHEPFEGPSGAVAAISAHRR